MPPYRQECKIDMPNCFNTCNFHYLFFCHYQIIHTYIILEIIKLIPFTKGLESSLILFKFIALKMINNLAETS